MKLPLQLGIKNKETLIGKWAVATVRLGTSGTVRTATATAQPPVQRRRACGSLWLSALQHLGWRSS